MPTRRAALAGGVAALAAPALARSAEQGVIRFVPQADLGSADPVWTTATVTRNHAYMVYDTLYGMTSALEPRPQMAEGEEVDADGRQVTITLRDGLRFHDGEPVRAVDCVASIARWAKRNSFGQAVEAATDELAALDDRRLRFRLKRPFPQLPAALGNVSQPAFIMPARVAATDPFRQIDDLTGSGPFHLRRGDIEPGHLIAYQRNPAYVPRGSDEPDLTSGPKRVAVDRVEWRIIPDAATASAALQAGEVDWHEQPLPEQVATLRRHVAVRVEALSPFPHDAYLRLNALHPPFDDPALRRAILPAIVQEDFMAAVVGDDRGAWRHGGVFTPGTPMASTDGLEPLLGPRSLQRARDALRQAGYAGQLVRLIGPTDLLAPAALTQVAADLFRRLGLNLELDLSDWATVLRRRMSQAPPDRGGWSALLTNASGFNFTDPGSHPVLRGNGTGPGSFPGWPTIPRLEQLREAWLAAPDFAARRAICRDIQRVAINEVAFVPLGAFVAMTALRRDLSGRIGGLPTFWNLRRG